MKKSAILSLCAAAALSCAAQKPVTLEVTLSNPLKAERADVPVVIDLAKYASFPVRGASVTVNGQATAWQLDDLNGDLRPDELAFTANVGPKAKTTATVILSPVASSPKGNPRTRAYIKLNDVKKHHPEVTAITFPGDANLLDMYNAIYGHGAVIETEPVALRIYMDNRQSIDIYSKTTPQLELDTTGFYTTRAQLAAGFGCDILWAGKSVGAGSFRGIRDGNPCYIDTVATRGQRIVADGPVRSIVDVTDLGWIYNGHPVDMHQRYTMWAGHRDLTVDITLAGALPSDAFCTGAQKLETDNTGFCRADGLCGSWGSNIPDKGAPDLVEEVGLGISVAPQWLGGVNEDQYNYLARLRPDSDGHIRYNVTFCGAREKGGFKNSAQWFDHLNNWHKTLSVPCTITIKTK